MSSISESPADCWRADLLAAKKRSENGDWLRVFEVPVPVFGSFLSTSGALGKQMLPARCQGVRNDFCAAP